MHWYKSVGGFDKRSRIERLCSPEHLATACVGIAFVVMFATTFTANLFVKGFVVAFLVMGVVFTAAWGVDMKRRHRRELDLEEVWPEMLEDHSSAEDARLAFARHMGSSPAWKCVADAWSDEEFGAFFDQLVDTREVEEFEIEVEG